MEQYKISAINHFLTKRGYSGISSENSASHQLLFIKKLPIYARIANTSFLVQQGLMGVTKLGQNEGCLLDFNRETIASLWMKNCKINLQAATIDKDGKIIDILDMYYQDPYRVHYSSQPIRYVLEMNESFFSNRLIKSGDYIRRI